MRDISVLSNAADGKIVALFAAADDDSNVAFMLPTAQRYINLTQPMVTWIMSASLATTALALTTAHALCSLVRL